MVVEPIVTHALLQRQMRRQLPPDIALQPEMREFFAAVDQAYRQFDEDRRLSERSQELASREIQEANSHMRAVFQCVPDAFVRIDAQGVIGDVSGGETAWRCLAHLRPPVGRSVFDAFPAALHERVRAAMETVLRTGEPASMDACLETAGGRELVEARLLPLFEGHLLLVLHDIRERKRAEEASRQSQQLLSAILDSAAEGVCGLDSHGRIAFLNLSAEGLLKRTRAQLLGSDFHALVHGADGGACTARTGGCAVLAGLRASESVNCDSESFRRSDGATFQVEMVVSPLRDSESGLTGAVVTFRDVSERNRLRSQLAQAQKLESIGHLAAGIAHEINTPMQYIGDNTRFVRDSLQSVCTLLNDVRAALSGPCPEDRPAGCEALNRRLVELDLDYLLTEMPLALDQSLEGIGQVARIVRSMKEFAHPGGDVAVAADLNKAIEGTTVVARNEWKYVAELELELDPALPRVPCVLGSINQVVLNLIINAAHAIEDKGARDDEHRGRITISTCRDGDSVRIDVRDTGTGIPEAVRARVFDPFFTTKPVGRGTGQGLALAHAVVVDKHGGSIGFDTEVGVGTTFHVHLPLERALEAA